MKSNSLWTQIAACSALVLATTAAHANLYNFTLAGGYTASWQLDSSVSPNESLDDGYFTYYDVPGFPGATFGVADVVFFNSNADGGLLIDDFYGNTTLLSALGPQLYTGLESAPTFKTGTFVLVEDLGTATYTLTIAAATAVPEPASVALMLGGLGVVGAAATRRRKCEVVDDAVTA